MPNKHTSHERGTRWTLIALLLGGCTWGCRSNAQWPAAGVEATGAQRVTIGGVQWYVDYDAALAVAREQDKALWVHFGENPG